MFAQEAIRLLLTEEECVSNTPVVMVLALAFLGTFRVGAANGAAVHFITAHMRMPANLSPDGNAYGGDGSALC